MTTPAHSEEQGSPKESWKQGTGYEVTRVFRCAWADRWEVAALYLGTASPLSAYCIATSATADPVQAEQRGVDATAAYEDALVTVQFTTLSRGRAREKVGGQIISERIEGATEFLTVSNKGFYWDAGGTTELTEKEAPGQLFHMADYLFTIYDLDDIPDAALSLCGSVNRARLITKTPGLNYYFDPETLLLQPAQVSRTVSVDNEGSLSGLKWQLDLKFTWKSVGWNVFLREYTKTYDRIYHAGAIYYLYPLADFSVF